MFARSGFLKLTHKIGSLGGIQHVAGYKGLHFLAVINVLTVGERVSYFARAKLRDGGI